MSFLRRLTPRGEFFLGRRNAYRNCFHDDEGKVSASGERVLADLKRFCGYAETSVRPLPNGQIDPLQVAQREGRREAFLRIVRHLNCSDEDILRMQEQVEAMSGTKGEFNE